MSPPARPEKRSPPISRCSTIAPSYTTKKGPSVPPRVDFLDPSLAPQRKVYFRTLFVGGLSMIFIVFAVFSIYWGAQWKTPAHKLQGWIVDLDGGEIGSVISSALLADSVKPPAAAPVDWQLHHAESASEVRNLVSEQNVWVAIVINADASKALASAGFDYDGKAAITVFVSEGRNENAYRSLIRPYVTTSLQSIATNFAIAHVSSDLVDVSPQALVAPIGWKIDNIHPFNVPVASAVTFVGLVLLLITSFLIVQVGGAARLATGLEPRLTTASLIRVRLTSTITIYFIVSLFYATLSRAFQVNFDKKFPHSGFVVFWMVVFFGMMALGLALEAMVTLLTPRFLPYFLILWLLSNVSTASMPLEVLPWIYHYGYAFPFYNISCAVRSIIFDTKNELGLHFGVLIAWAVLSMITLTFFQWFRRRPVGAKESKEQLAAEVEDGERTSMEE